MAAKHLETFAGRVVASTSAGTKQIDVAMDSSSHGGCHRSNTQLAANPCTARPRASKHYAEGPQLV
jgi:hypothetical protein